MHLDKDMAVFLQGLAKASSLSQLSVSLRVTTQQYMSKAVCEVSWHIAKSILKR